jgi:hypothetical protein
LPPELLFSAAVRSFHLPRSFHLGAELDNPGDSDVMAYTSRTIWRRSSGGNQVASGGKISFVI